jgi:FkbM family methyltransferase
MSDEPDDSNESNEPDESDDDPIAEMARGCRGLATEADFMRSAAGISAIDRHAAQCLERRYQDGAFAGAVDFGRRFLTLFEQELLPTRPFLEAAAARVRYHYGIALLLHNQPAEAVRQIDLAFRQEVFLTEHHLDRSAIAPLIDQILAEQPDCAWAQYEKARITLALPRFNLDDGLSLCRKDIQFFIQIGAMDGKTYDPIYRYVNGSRWRGIIVEPIPALFEQLKANYQGRRNLIFENVAITEADGEREMTWIPEQTIREHQLPGITKGIATLLPDRNYIRLFHSYAKTARVQTTTLKTLLARHDVKRIDLLQIDAEGYDIKILDQLDLSLFKPCIINIEIASCPPAERVACFRRLHQNGYALSFDGGELCAVRHPQFPPARVATDGSATRHTSERKD